MSNPPATHAAIAERLEIHARRLAALPDEKAALAFHHFLGAVGAMCEPTSLINKGPTRTNLLLALERAINAQTGT